MLGVAVAVTVGVTVTVVVGVGVVGVGVEVGVVGVVVGVVGVEVGVVVGVVGVGVAVVVGVVGVVVGVGSGSAMTPSPHLFPLFNHPVESKMSLFEAMVADIERAKREDRVWVDFFDVILGLDKTDDRLEAYKRAQREIDQETFND